jgi:hypothetical protein
VPTTENDPPLSDFSRPQPDFLFSQYEKRRLQKVLIEIPRGWTPEGKLFQQILSRIFLISGNTHILMSYPCVKEQLKFFFLFFRAVS